MRPRLASAQPSLVDLSISHTKYFRDSGDPAAAASRYLITCKIVRLGFRLLTQSSAAEFCDSPGWAGFHSSWTTAMSPIAPFLVFGRTLGGYVKRPISPVEIPSRRLVHELRSCHIQVHAGHNIGSFDCELGPMEPGSIRDNSPTM